MPLIYLGDSFHEPAFMGHMVGQIPNSCSIVYSARQEMGGRQVLPYGGHNFVIRVPPIFDSDWLKYLFAVFKKKRKENYCDT